MPQINKGDTFADGQQVTAARLNQLVDSATILVDSITAQTAITAGTVDTADQVNISDTSAAALRKATIGDLLGSNVPVVTSSVTAGSGSDIVVTPNDATIVTGSTYTSADGLTVVVTTAAAHGLSVGQVLLISAAGSGYNGTFRLTVAAGSSFTYVMPTAATAGSGSLSYIKKATNKVSGNLAVNQNLYVDGAMYLNSSTTFAQSVSTNGALVVNGSLTSNGTANFTGALQVNGTVGYVLTEITEETMTPYIATTPGYFSAIWTSTAFVKPSEEIWVFETVSAHSGIRGWSYDFAFRYGSQTAQSGQYLALHAYYDIGNSGIRTTEVTTDRWVVNAGTAIASDTVKVDVYAGSGSGMTLFQTTTAPTNITNILGGTLAASKFRIYKYRTA